VQVVPPQPAVSAAPSPGGNQPANPETVALNDLPRPVSETRNAILDAVRLGDIEELRPPLEWSSPPTILGAGAGQDPIEHLRQTSADAEGHQVLAILATLLAGPPAKLQAVSLPC